MLFIRWQNYIGELSNADKKLEWARHHVGRGFEGQNRSVWIFLSFILHIPLL